MAVERRQQNGGGTTSTAAASVSSATSAPGSSGSSGSSNTASASSNTGSNASGSGVTTASAATTSAPAIGITGGPGFNPNATHISIAPNGNPGEIVFTQPPLQSTSFYKIAPGNTVTFGWNFTNLAITPTSLTVSAACENGNTYPVGPTDGVIPGDAQSVEWYPYGYQTSNPSLPLAQAEYTLLICGAGGFSAIPTPGYLAPNSQLRFALYTPQPYTPLASGWPCPGCHVAGAIEQFKAHPASIALITTLLVVFLSGFTTLRRVWD